MNKEYNQLQSHLTLYLFVKYTQNTIQLFFHHVIVYIKNS